MRHPTGPATRRAFPLPILVPDFYQTLFGLISPVLKTLGTSRGRGDTAIAASKNPRIFLSAGEASGDHYGAQLINSLKSHLPEASFFGLGGLEMERAGQRRVVRAEDVAHMGITEVLRHAPYIYAQYRKLVAALERDRPAIAILIDFPDVNLRLAAHCKRLGIPVVYLVSPQLWAWKRRRLRWVQERVTRMLVIFPFEAAFYRARNVDAEFLGHPLAYLPLPTSSRLEYAAQRTIAGKNEEGFRELLVSEGAQRV